MALQNILGMICDPVANRVEVPCLGKNVMAASQRARLREHGAGRLRRGHSARRGDRDDGSCRQGPPAGVALHRARRAIGHEDIATIELKLNAQGPHGITAIETIPVSVPVGRFRDGMDKVAGQDAPTRYHKGAGAGNRTAAQCRRLHDAVECHRQDSHRRRNHRHRRGGVRPNRAGRGRPGDDRPPHGAQIDRRGPPGLAGADRSDELGVPPGAATRFSTSGIDLALHDLAGRIPGRAGLYAAGRLPTRESARRDRGTTRYGGAYGRAQLRVLPARGCGIKAKVGSEPVRDAKCIVAIREKLGHGISLRADANCGYTLSEAKIFCKLVEASGRRLELLEQPLETHDLAGFRELRNATALPIEVDQHAYSLSMVQLILKHDAADIINTKCAKAGGIKGVTEWAAVAEASHRPIVIGHRMGAAA